MPISIDRLSLWEIAHRWHDVDPSHSKTVADIPLDVKDTLRNLAAEIYYERLYSTLLLERETTHLEAVFRRRWPYFWKKTHYKKSVSDFEQEFKATINNTIVPEFLQSIMIPHWELKYWCKEYDIPFPDFWVRSLLMGGTKAPFPGAIEFTHENDDSSLEFETDATISAEEKPKSDIHSRAAYKRHEPVNQLKRKCVLFSLTQKGSNKQIANRFYASLSDEEKKLVSAPNSERLFSNAISAFKKGAHEDWLKDIPPLNYLQT
jgi:hypothetical protein